MRREHRRVRRVHPLTDDAPARATLEPGCHDAAASRQAFLAVVFFAAVFFVVVFLAAVFFVAAFFVDFLAAFLRVEGPLARFSASSS